MTTWFSTNSNLNKKITKSKGANAAIGAGATLVGGLLNKGLSGGMTSGAGTMISSLGSTAGNIVSLFNPIAGAAVTVGSNLLGGITNNLFGSKLNKENIAKVENNIKDITLRGSAIGSASSADEFLRNTSAINMGFDFSNSFIGKDGIFGGNKAKRTAEDLRRRLDVARAYTKHAITTGALGLDMGQDSSVMSNFAAFGGPLDNIFAYGGYPEYNIDPSTAIGYAMLTDELMKAKSKDNNMTNLFAGTPSIFAFGGNTESNGANWSDGTTHINVGGSHELNPNDGVLLGVDNEGTPNLVEEGEVIWDDYVFSNRLIVPRGRRGNYGKRNVYAKGGKLEKNSNKKNKEEIPYEEKVLKPYEGLTFAEAAKKIEKKVGADERANDPIALAGLEATLKVLASVQEKEREKEKLKELQEAIDLMSPEELAMLQQQMVASQQQANQQAMAEQRQQMIPQGMELMQYPMEEQQPIAALGGLLNGWNPVNKFAKGGNSRDEDWYNLLPEGFIRWLVDSYNLNNNEDLEKIPSEYQEALKRVYEYALDPTYKDYPLQALWSESNAVDPDLMKSIIETGIANRSFDSLTSDELNNLARSYIKSLDAFKEKHPYSVYGDRERQDVSDYIGEYFDSGKIPEVPALTVESEVTPLAVEPVVETPVTTSSTSAIITKELSQEELDRILKEKEFENWWDDALDKEEKYNEYKGTDFGSIYKYITGKDDLLKSGEVYNALKDLYVKDSNKFKEYNAEQARKIAPSSNTSTVQQEEEKVIPTVTAPEAEKPLEETTASEVTIDGPEAEVLDWYNRNNDTKLNADTWSKLSDRTRDRYIKLYKDSFKDKAKKEDFDNRLNAYNQQQDYKKQVEDWQTKLNKSYLSKEDLNKFLYKDLERIAKVVNPKYENKNLAGLSVNDEKKAVEDLRDNIVNWAKDNENGTVEAINNAFSAPNAHENWARTLLDDEKRWTPSGYDYGEFAKRTAAYNGSLTLGNTAGKYAPDSDSNFNLGEFKDVKALEADLSYLDYTTAVENAINNNRNVRWRPKDPTKYGLNNLEFEDSNNTFNLEDYDLLRALNNQVIRTKTNPNGKPIPIIDIDEDGWMSFNDKSAELFRDSRNDGMLGAMHLTPIKRKASELYTLDDKDYYSLTDIEAKTPNWRDLYTEAPLTTKLDDGTIVHKLSYNAPLRIDRADSLPDGLKKNDDGTYSSKNGTESDPFPKPSNWPYLAAGLALLGALGYNIFSKPDYSNADALLKASAEAGKYKPVEFRPIGNYLTYKPMDIWYELNRLNANARATDRAIMNNAAPIGTKMMGLLANAYNNQKASGNLYRLALEYNDAQEEKKATFNKDTDKFNSEGFLKADMANQDAYSRAKGFSLEGQKAGYAMRQAIDDAKAASINAGINGLIGLGSSYAQNKYNQDMIAWAIRNGAFGQQDIAKTLKGTNAGAKGGKINRKKKGLNF